VTLTREALWLALILSAPWAVVLVVALVRGYSITLVLTRSPRRRDGRGNGV
jgi:type III secretory pathway component EscS